MTTTSLRLLPGFDIFDSTHDALLGSDIHAAMTLLRTSLRTLRAELQPDHWRTVGQQVRNHPVHQLLLASPFTRRAFTKPRGYAGDAALMDLIYGAASPGTDDMSALGAMLYAYEFDSFCFQSVRTRRAILAREIDDVAAQVPNAHILAVACGHLREIEWSRAARSAAVSITALDQDGDSLDFISQHYGGYDVTPLQATVGDVLRRPLRLDNLALAYAAGLYDYLDDDLARVLTSALFRMLRPGGRLLVANFTPETRDAAYMEAIMDWHLIYRSADGVRALLASIPARDIAAVEQFSDESNHITYMRVVKR